MTDLALKRHYAELSGEERFRLILAASGRGDTVEKERLSKAGRRINLVTPDHAPAAFAFHELSLLTFIEVADAAGFFREVMLKSDHDAELAYERKQGKVPTESADETDDEEDVEDDYVPLDKEGLVPRDRWMEMTLAAGCILREKAKGWVLFCERIGVPPFSLWTALPGYDRLKRDLEIAETVAFTRKGLWRWLNRIRPGGDAKVKRVLSAKRLARESEEMYRGQVRWWGGE